MKLPNLRECIGGLAGLLGQLTIGSVMKLESLTPTARQLVTWTENLGDDCYLDANEVELTEVADKLEVLKASVSSLHWQVALYEHAAYSAQLTETDGKPRLVFVMPDVAKLTQFLRMLGMSEGL